MGLRWAVWLPVWGPQCLLLCLAPWIALQGRRGLHQLQGSPSRPQHSRFKADSKAGLLVQVEGGC